MSFDASNHTTLQEIGLGEQSNLETCNLSGASAITGIDIRGTKVSTLDLSASSSTLQVLEASKNQLTAFDLSGVTNQLSLSWGYPNYYLQGQSKTISSCSIINGKLVVPIDNAAENGRIYTDATHKGVIVNSNIYTNSAEEYVITSNGQKYLVIGDGNNIPTGPATVTYYYNTGFSGTAGPNVPSDAFNLMPVTLTVNTTVEIMHKIVLTTSKQVGETIYLSHNYSGDILISGVEEAPQGSDLGYQTLDGKFVPKFAYTLTDQTVTIYGDVTRFRCHAQDVTSLDVSQNDVLYALYCQQNPLQALDVSDNTALTHLNTQSCQLTTLDLSTNTSLAYLNTNNQKKTVDFEIVDGYYCLEINSDAENELVSEVKLNGTSVDLPVKVLSKGGKKYLAFASTAGTMPSSGENTVTYKYAHNGPSDLSADSHPIMDVTLSTNISNGTIKVVPGIWETRIALDYDTNVGLTVEGISDLTEPGASGEYATYRTDEDNSEEIIFTGLISSISADGQGIAAIDLTGNPYLTSVSLTDNQLMWLDLSKNKSLSDETGNGIDGQKRDVYVCKVGDYWVVPMMYGAKELKISHMKVGDNNFTPQLISDDAAKTSYLVVGNATDACPAQGTVITYDYITDNNTYPLMDVTLTITSVPGAIELYTDKAVGDNFSLSIKGAGTIIVSGIDGVGTLTTDGFSPLSISGTLNSQTVRIEGTVSELTCNSQSLNGIKVDEAPGLTSLTVKDNNLTTINLENNLYLKYLTCDQNDLTGLDVTNNTELTYLSCVDCALTELDVTQNTKLKELYVGYDVPRGTRNNMTSGSIDLSENTALQKVHVENVGLNTLDVTNNLDLIDLYASTNNLTTIDLTENTDLQNLDLAHNRLPEIDLDLNTELVYLDLTTNLLPSINVRKNTKLQDFRISDNLLPTLDVTTLADLRLLNCGINQLPSIDVTRNPLLERLWCYTNELTEINTTNNPNLKGLYCEENLIEALDATVNPKLLSLTCHRNRISSLEVEGLTELRWLTCSDNELYSLDVSTCTNIGNPYDGYYREFGFDCSRNHLMTLDLSQNEHMNTNSEASVTLFGGQTLPVTPVLVDGYLTIKMPDDAANNKVSSIVADGVDYVLSTKVTTQDNKKYLCFAKATKDKHYGANTVITYDYETGLDMMPTHMLMDVTLTMQNAHVQKIGSEGYGTLYLDYPALIPDGAEVYIVTDDCINKEEQVVELDKEANRISGSTVPANTPMLTKATAGEYILFNRSGEEGTAPEGNLMKGTMEDITVAAKSVVTLGHESSSGEYGFWIYSGTTVHAWRTYMELDDVKGKMIAANAKGFALRFMDDNETTGIKRLNSDGLEGVAYTLDGKKVCEAGQWSEAKSLLPKGIYILGGRKVVIK